MSSALSAGGQPRRPVDGQQLRARVAPLVAADAYLWEPEKLVPYARDETHGLQPVTPDAVVLVRSHEETRAVMRACAELGVPVTARGAGTGRSGGCVAAQGGVVLGFERMNRVRELDVEDGVAVVEPGVILGQLQEAVEARGLFYPPDPASLATCTLGGNVAENAGGPRAVKYGVTRDYVLGARAVLADGTELKLGGRTMKGVSGYDLAALVCGSEGTLALLTEITLKLVPRPVAVQTALVAFPTAGHAARAVTAIMAGGVNPRSLEYLDGPTLDAVRPLARCPLPPTAAALLVVETDGPDEDSAFRALARAVELAEGCGAHHAGVARDDAQRKDIWDMRHQLSAATRRITGQKVSEDVVVPRKRVPEMVAAVAELGERHGLRTCAFGHAGDGNLHVQVLFEDRQRQRDAIDACMRAVTERSIALGGRISGEHGVGLAKRGLLHLEQSAELMALQRRIKTAFDPRDLLNPGKIFPPA